MRLGWVCVRCGWGKELVLQWGRLKKKIKFTNSFSNYFVLDFVHAVFALGGKVILLQMFFEATILENLLYITLCAYPPCLKHSSVTYS